MLAGQDIMIAPPLRQGPVSDDVGCAPKRAELHAGTGVLGNERRPAVEKRSKVYVGLVVHKDSIRVGAAAAGREPVRLVSKVPHDVSKLTKILARAGSATGIAPRVRGRSDGLRSAAQAQRAGL